MSFYLKLWYIKMSATPIIATITKDRAARLAKSDKQTLAIRLKVLGTKDEVITLIANPFVQPESFQQSGDGFFHDLKKATTKVGKIAELAIPIAAAASAIPILAPVAAPATAALTGVAAIGELTEALKGNGKGKKKAPPQKGGRYSIMTKA
jgi:hypothetical protein